MVEKIDIKILDEILHKTIETISETRDEIYEISDTARRQYHMQEEEYKMLKEKVQEYIASVEILEKELQIHKRKLFLVNKNFNRYTEEDFRQAYEKADEIRIKLAVKREQLQFYINRRNEIEIMLKDSLKTIERADKLITRVGAVLGYLSGDLKDIVVHIENLQQKQALGIKIIKAQEDERQRVAREIHDGPAQSMSNVVLKAEICEKLLEVDLNKAKEEIINLKKIVRESLQDVRKIIYDLRPMSLDDLGLVPTLQKYIATTQDSTGLNINFKTRGDSENVSPVISLTVFRIVQEALNNIVKHANANNAFIKLEFAQDKMNLSIIDDGKGFDVNSVKLGSDDMSSGFGLLGMRERAELLGGNFSLSSKPGKGTCINITIPKEKDEGVSHGE